MITACAGEVRDWAIGRRWSPPDHRERRSLSPSEDVGMGQHVEWVDSASVRVILVEAGEVEDSYGTENERHALVLHGDDEVVIEGTIPELRALVERMSRRLPPVG